MARIVHEGAHLYQYYGLKWSVKVESAALAGHSQAVSTLASTFERGLRDGAGDALLVAPDAALSACWRGAAEQPADARRCAAMRSGRR